MSLSELPPWAAALLDDIPVGHLGLLDEHAHPRVQPITFARVGDAIWTAIDDKPKRRREPARIARLRQRPHAAFTVDRYDEDWANLAWVQVLATAAVHDEPQTEVVEALQHRYPAYRAQPPRGPFVQLTPERVLWWRAGG